MALFLAAGAIAGSVAYGVNHRQHTKAASSDSKDQADTGEVTRASTLPFADDMHVKLGHPAELGGVLVTVRDVRCGKKIPADTLRVWSRSESGLPCIVDTSVTTGVAPVNLNSDAQTLSDDKGHVYQVSSLQRLFSCDQVYDRQLDVRTTVQDGCLLYTLESGARPASITLIHGLHSAVVAFADPGR